MLLLISSPVNIWWPMTAAEWQDPEGGECLLNESFYVFIDTASYFVVTGLLVNLWVFFFFHPSPSLLFFFPFNALTSERRGNKQQQKKRVDGKEGNDIIRLLPAHQRHLTPQGKFDLCYLMSSSYRFVQDHVVNHNQAQLTVTNNTAPNCHPANPPPSVRV